MTATAVPPQELWTTSRQTSLRLLAFDAPQGGDVAAVLLHGLVTGIDVLRDAAGAGRDPYTALAAQGVHVLGLDWPGHGRSGGSRGHVTYRAAMDAAAAAVDAARERWGVPVGLVGTGLGGALGFYAALEDDDVVAVACHDVLDLRDVQAVVQRWRQGAVLPVAGRLARALVPARQRAVTIPARWVVAPADLASDPDLSRRLRMHPQAVRSYDLEALASILLSPQDKPDIAAQATPTLVLVGDGDRVLPEVHARAFTSRLTCPSELFVLPGGGHQLLLEHPAATLPRIAAHLRAHLPAA